MSLNKITQEELERIEAEIYAELTANAALNQFEKPNLIGNHKYGWPKLPEDSEENIGSSERTYTS